MEKNYRIIYLNHQNTNREKRLSDKLFKVALNTVGYPLIQKLHCCSGIVKWSWVLSCVLIFLNNVPVFSQNTPLKSPQKQLPPLNESVPQDTSKSEVITIEWADVFTYAYIEAEDDTLQRLVGNVELSQDTVYMYCDSARVKNGKHLTALGNVIIQQGDSISIFSDSLVYFSDTRIADLYGDVVLVNRGQKLFTNHLEYNLKTDIGTYFDGATVTNDTTYLTSKRGYYYTQLDEIFFKDSVVVFDSSFTMRSDTLKFNTETRIATFLGPTLITQDSSKIYCESGFYNIKTKLAEFKETPQYMKGDQQAVAEIILYDGNKKEVVLDGEAQFIEGERIATADRIRYEEDTETSYLEGNAWSRDTSQTVSADTIIYNSKKETYSTRGRSYISDPPMILEANQVDYDKEREIGVALGDVIWQDTSEGLTILCELADYDQSADYLKASGGNGEFNRPMLITEIDGDSLFMVSDTLISEQADTLKGDSSRILLAFKDVRIFKNDLQALCDSLVYNTADSLFNMYVNPIIWSDTTQFKADTVVMQLANNKMDRIYLYNNSMMVNSPDELFFNQIKGKNSIAYFEEGEVRKMKVEGNAESVYYALDDEDAYIGVNQAVCSEMMILFGNNEVEGIKFYAQPKATLFPMQKADHDAMKLPGFSWEVSRRPTSIFDLFNLKNIVFK
ncbi:MAG: hypothetical protein NXI23_26310 [Bacteroidetes bacterium]|jgi:lipopolysaccharide export system protein LptA|nr:hypothetical protein [Bacteroidota bacterium]MDF1865857.1 OstA-like protein [Saprospiraceae bacterium]